MTIRIRCAARSCACMLTLSLAASAGAVKVGTTTQGRPYASGGVGQQELVALQARRSDYSLWVITAATTSGAYLADVSVIVRDANQHVVFDDRLDGPWLFVDLPLGRYEVEATYRGRTDRRTTTIHAGDHHQLFFYFDTGDEAVPDRQPSFPGNPFGNGAAL